MNGDMAPQQQLQDFDYVNITNGTAVNYNKLLQLRSGSVGIDSVTVVNNSSLTVSIFPNAQEPAGTGIQIPAGASITAPIAGLQNVFVSCVGVPTFNGFIYIHWADQTLSAFAANVTPTNVNVSNNPLNVNISAQGYMPVYVTQLPSGNSALFVYEHQSTVGNETVTIATIAANHLYITDVVAVMQCVNATAAANGDSFSLTLEPSVTPPNFYVPMEQQTGPITAGQTLAAMLQAHFNTPPPVPNGIVLQYNAHFPASTSSQYNLLLLVTGYTI